MRNFKTDLQKLYKEQMVGLILYGSYARNEAKEFSDVDILVVLKTMKSPYEEIHKMSDINYEYLEQHEILKRRE